VKNPFPTLECIHEHVESAMTALAQEAGIPPREFREKPPAFGSSHYHLKAAEAATCRLYQQLAVLLPGLRDLDEGEVSEGIVRELGGEGPGDA
jgi:hypothetical protein